MEADTTNKVLSKQVRAKQGGWAVTEVLIGLIISLLALAGVFVLVQMAFSNTTLSTAQSNLMTTKSSIKRVFTGQSDYEALTNTVASQSGLVPSSMIVGDTSSGDLTNAFGGNVTLSPDDGDGAGLAAAAGIVTKTNSYYSVEYTGVPQEACIELSSYTRSEWAGGVDVNGTAIDVFTDGADPVLTQVNAACNNGQNTILFVHR